MSINVMSLVLINQKKIKWKHAIVCLMSDSDIKLSAMLIIIIWIYAILTLNNNFLNMNVSFNTLHFYKPTFMNKVLFAFNSFTADIHGFGSVLAECKRHLIVPENTSPALKQWRHHRHDIMLPALNDLIYILRSG